MPVEHHACRTYFRPYFCVIKVENQHLKKKTHAIEKIDRHLWEDVDVAPVVAAADGHESIPDGVKCRTIRPGVNITILKIPKNGVCKSKCSNVSVRKIILPGLASIFVTLELANLSFWNCFKNPQDNYVYSTGASVDDVWLLKLHALDKHCYKI
jgi:hypothetical protein